MIRFGVRDVLYWISNLFLFDSHGRSARWYCQALTLDTWENLHFVQYFQFSSTLTSFNPISLSLLLAPFSASAWKIAVVCNDVLPTCCFSSFLASSHSQALSPQSLVFRSQSRKESGHCLYFITCDTPGHKRKPLSLLLFYSTLSPLHSRQTEPGPALHLALHIMMSLKSLFSSFPLNTLPLLLSSSSLALSFSVPLLLSPCSPSQPEPENKRDQTQVPSSSL